MWPTIGMSASARSRTASRAPSLDVPAPSIADLLEGFPAPAWLERDASALAASPAPLDRVAAVGLVARLWTPTGSDAAVAIERLLAGAPSPVQRATTWAAGLGPEVLADVERIAVDDAVALADDADGLIMIAAERRDALPEAVMAAATRRDDLESIAVLLGLAATAELLRMALADADRAFALVASVFHEHGPLADPRLEAVSWKEPDAWWGALALHG